MCQPSYKLMQMHLSRSVFLHMVCLCDWWRRCKQTLKGRILNMISNFDFPSCITAVVCDVQLFFLTEDLMSGSRKLWMIPRLFSDTRAGSVWRQCQVGHILWAKKSSHHRRYHNITITVILDDLKIALETVSSFSNPPPPPMMKTTYLQVFSSDRDVPAWSRFSAGRLWWTNCQITVLGPL